MGAARHVRVCRAASLRVCYRTHRVCHEACRRPRTFDAMRVAGAEVEAVGSAADNPADDPTWARRYARQLALPGFGVEGQRRLAAARVLVVGAGGLGSPVALSLAAMGVGTLGLADFDTVDLSNLHRQLLYGAADVGRPKVEAARDRLAAIGARTAIVLHPLAVDGESAAPLVAAYDLVVDATDTLAVRYALSDACVRLGRPMVHGSVSRFEGRVTVLAVPGGPCYRCLWPERPGAAVPTCAEAGVLGVVPGVVGMLQAAEAVKWIARIGTPLVGRLLVLDLLGAVTHDFIVEPDPLCPACRDGQIATATPEAVPGVASPAGDPGPSFLSPSVAPMTPDPAVASPDGHDVPEISPAEVAERLRLPQPPILIDVREPWEHQVARIAGARLVPLASLGAALSTFDPAAEYVLLCHHGVRSLAGVRFLRERGLTRVANLTGGIDAWSADVDPSVPRY